jgi:hypothetical protein
MRVDERGDHTDLGQTEPNRHVLDAILHEQGDNVSAAEACNEGT